MGEVLDLELSSGHNEDDVCYDRFCILGDVGSPVFQNWIRNHAIRLGVECRILLHSAKRLELTITGPDELVNAMVLGCSLGPQEVMVDDVVRLPKNSATDAESSSIKA
ncbi:MAG: hypothetical protein ACOH2H_03550 [Cypionkella sp.]